MSISPTPPVVMSTRSQPTTGPTTRNPYRPNSRPTKAAMKAPPPKRAMGHTPAASSASNQPAAPGSGYTNASLAAAIAAAVNDKFGGQDQQLGQLGRQLDTRQTAEIPAWFQAYRTQLQGAQTAQAAAAQQQAASLQNMATQAQGDTGGQFTDPAAMARAQAAAGIRGAGVLNQGALAQNLGSLQGNYLGNLGQLSFGQQAGALQHVADQRVSLGDQLTQLARDKGNFAQSEGESLLSAEADRALKAALTGSQIGQNTAQASAATTNAAATKQNAQTAAQKARAAEKAAANDPAKQKTAQQVAFFNTHGYYPTNGPAKSATAKAATPVSGPGSLTSSAEHKVVSQINKVVQALQNPTVTQVDPTTGVKTTKPATRAQALAQMKAQNIDPNVLKVAQSVTDNGGESIGPWGVKWAHKLGIHATNWKVVSK